MMLCWCTLVLLTLVPVVTGDNSVVKVKLTQQGLNLVAGKSEEFLQQFVRNKEIPDKKIIFEAYTVTGTKIDMERLNVELALGPETGVTITIQSENTQVTGNIMGQNSNRQFNVKMDTLAITATVPVKVDKTGQLTLNIENCKVTFGSIGSWLVDKIPKDKFLSFIINKWGCSKLTTILNTQLATFYAKVHEYIGVDVSVVPVISKDSIELSFVILTGRKKRLVSEKKKDSPEI